MRQRVAQIDPMGRVFERDDGDEPMDAVVRRFWSRGRSRHGSQALLPDVTGATAIDLALWRRARS